MRTGPLVKRKQRDNLAQHFLGQRNPSLTAAFHVKKNGDVSVGDVRVTAANPDNLPQLATIIDLFAQDAFSLFQLSFPHLQEKYSSTSTVLSQTSSGCVVRTPQKASLQKLFQRHLSRDATLLTVRRGRDLLSATLLRPLWNIPNAIEILAFGINWTSPRLASLLSNTPVSSHTSGLEFIPSVRQREFLSQYLLYLSISKLPSSSPSEPSLFTIVNHTQKQYAHSSHLSLLDCYSVGTLKVRGSRERCHVQHIFALPTPGITTQWPSTRGRVSPSRQRLILDETRSRYTTLIQEDLQHQQRAQRASLKKTYIPECIRLSLMNVIEDNQPLMGLHYEITQGLSQIKASQIHPLQQGGRDTASLGLHTCLLTKKSNVAHVEALYKSGKDLMAVIPLVSGETYGIFGEYRTSGISKTGLTIEKNNQLSARNSATMATPSLSGKQDEHAQILL